MADIIDETSALRHESGLKTDHKRIHEDSKKVLLESEKDLLNDDEKREEEQYILARSAMRKKNEIIRTQGEEINRQRSLISGLQRETLAQKNQIDILKQRNADLEAEVERLRSQTIPQQHTNEPKDTEDSSKNTVIMPRPTEPQKNDSEEKSKPEDTFEDDFGGGGKTTILPKPVLSETKPQEPEKPKSPEEPKLVTPTDKENQEALDFQKRKSEPQLSTEEEFNLVTSILISAKSEDDTLDNLIGLLTSDNLRGRFFLGQGDKKLSPHEIAEKIGKGDIAALLPIIRKDKHIEETYPIPVVMNILLGKFAVKAMKKDDPSIVGKAFQSIGDVKVTGKNGMEISPSLKEGEPDIKFINGHIQRALSLTIRHGDDYSYNIPGMTSQLSSIPKRISDSIIQAAVNHNNAQLPKEDIPINLVGR